MTTIQSTADNATPTGELPIMDARRVEAERLAAIVEQYCSARKTPKHRLGERPRTEVHAVAITGVVLRPRPPSPTPRMPTGDSVLARLLRGSVQ